jgi:DoxX-like family
LRGRPHRVRCTVASVFVALVVVVVLLTLVCVGSSIADVLKVPQVVESLDRLKVPMVTRPALPIMKTAGAIGLLVGLRSVPLGAFSGICLAAYFGMATQYHLRAKDKLADTAPAMVLCVLSVAAVLLRIGSA